MMRQITGRMLAWALILCSLLSAGGAEALAAELRLPSGLKQIGEASFYDDDSLETVVLPEGVESIGSLAFAESTVDTINLPGSLREIADDAFDGAALEHVVAGEGSYAFEWAIAHGYLSVIPVPVLTAASQNGSGRVTLRWASLGPAYRYRVYEEFGGGARALLTTEACTAEVEAASGGLHRYTVQAGLRTARGDILYGGCAGALEVDVRLLWDYDAQLTGAVQTAADALRLRWRGVSPADGYEIAELVGEEYRVCAAADPSEDELTLSGVGAGFRRYAVRASLHDGDTVWSSDWSEPLGVTVLPAERFAPAAPTLCFDDEALAFSAGEDEAPDYPQAGLSVAWEPNAYAQSCRVTLERKTAGGYVTVLERDALTENSLYLPEGLFAALTESTLFRFGLASVGGSSGETAYSYFRIALPDPSITVDGLSALRWERPSAYAGSRVFTVRSELPWTAESDVSWLHPTVLEDSLILDVDGTDNFSLRSGAVTLSNGSASAVVTVAQDNYRNPPTASWGGAALSTDSASPTVLPAGGLSLSITAQGCACLRVWEKRGGDYVDTGWSAVTSRDALSIPADCEAFSLSAGREFCLELSDHLSGDPELYPALETEGESPSARYYIRLSGEGHYVLLDRLEAASVLLPGEHRSSVTVSASNAWTAESDADWLSWSGDTESTVDTKCYLYGAENATGAARVGHLTVRCGAASAVVTVTQTVNAPALLSPAGVSRQESAPTQVTKGAYTVMGLYDTLLLESKSGGEWQRERYQSISASQLPANVDLCFYSTNLHRLTLSYGGETAVYYLKPKAALTSGSSITASRKLSRPAAASSGTMSLSASGSWSASSDASWLTVSPTSGSAGSTSLSVNTAANATASERTGTITFKLGSVVYARTLVTQSAAGTDRVTVTADGVPAEASRALAHVSGLASTLPLRVQASCATLSGGPLIQAVSNADWISVDASMLSDKNPNVKLTENTSGAPRTGTVTFTWGGDSRTIRITQEPALSAPAITTYAPGSKDAPTALDYDGEELTLFFAGDPLGAHWSSSLTALDAGSTQRWYPVTESAEGGCRVTVPAACFDVAYAGRYRLNVTAQDACGNTSPTGYFYFTRTAGGAVYLDGRQEAAWDDADDLPCSRSFTVAAPGRWTVETDESWIGLSDASGESGGVLTLSLAENTGARRGGTVTVRCGELSAAIAVNQCAALRAYPDFLSPALSEDESAPTVLEQAGTLTVSWTVEPQAEIYKVKVNPLPYPSTSVASSGNMRWKDHAQEWSGGVGSFSFDASGLTQGVVYEVTLIRSARDGSKACGGYFTLLPPSPFLTLAARSGGDVDRESLTFYAQGGDDCASYAVTASGTWTATVSDTSWMMVGSVRRDSRQLAEDGESSEDYAQYTGAPGRALYVSVLPNETGRARSGTVTVTTPGASRSFTVTQSQYYALPALSSPALGEKLSASVERPLESVPLTWTAGEGHTGLYTLTLKEKEGGSYYTVWESQSRTRGATIPASALKANAQYRLSLGVTLANSAAEDCTNYYFHTVSGSALRVTADVDWSQAGQGGYVGVTATASGGAGGYQYAYVLLCDGLAEQETDLSMPRYYQFRPRSTGAYRVVVTVRDASGATASCVSDFERTEPNALSCAVPNAYSAALGRERQSLGYTVLSGGDWTLSGCPDWVSPSALSGQSGASLTLAVSRNDGEERSAVLRITGSRGISSTLSLAQAGSGRLAPPVIQYPARDYDALAPGGFTLRWAAVSGAEAYVVSLRALDTDELLLYHKPVGGATSLALDAGLFTEGGAYRVAVGAVPGGASSTDAVVGWCERLFTVTPTAPATVELRGLVRTGQGEAIPGVSIRCLTAAGESVGTAVSDAQGRWSLNVPPSEARYIIRYESAGYAFEDAEADGSGGLVEAFGQPRERESGVSFTLEAGEIRVGEALCAEVAAENAAAVRLVVDGVAYESWPLVDGLACVERTIHMAGTRRVQFQAYADGEWGALSEARELNVTKIDDLDAPVLDVPSSVELGETLSVGVTPPANAEDFVLRLSLPGSFLSTERRLTAEELAALDSRVVFPLEALSRPGTYGLSVMATGAGYSQSESSVNIEVKADAYAITVTSPQDGASYRQNKLPALEASLGCGYARFRLEGPDGTVQFPEDGFLPAGSPLSCEAGPLTPGAYTLTACACRTEDSEDNPAVAVSEPVRFTVLGEDVPKPEIFKLQVGRDAGNYTWISPDDSPGESYELYIWVNSASDSVTVTENDSEQAAVYDEGKGYYRYSLQNRSAGKHTLAVKARNSALTDESGEPIPAQKSFSFYIARAPKDAYPVYPQLDAALYRAPLSSSVVTRVEGGSWAEMLWVIREAGDWLQVETHRGEIGFIKTAQVASTVKNELKQVELLSPAQGAQLVPDAEGKITVSWRASATLLHPTSGYYRASVYVFDGEETWNSATRRVYNLSSCSDLYETGIDVSDLPNGEYNIQVCIAYWVGSGVQRVEYKYSNKARILLGPYSPAELDDQAYRDWYRANVFPAMNQFIENFGEYYRDTTAFNLMQRAYTLSDFLNNGYINTGKYYVRSTVTKWSSMEDEERRKIDLVILGDLLTEASEQGVVMRYDRDSLNAEVDVAAAEALTQTIMDVADVAVNGFKTGVYTKLLLSGNMSNNDKIDFVEKLFDCAYESLKLWLTQCLKTYDTTLLLEAYQKEYTKALRRACGAYVDYLENTIFGGIGRSGTADPNYMDRREESAMMFIQSCRDYQAKPDREIRQDAMRDLLSYALDTDNEAGYLLTVGGDAIDLDRLEAYSEDFRAFLADYVSDPATWVPVLKNALLDVLQAGAEIFIKKLGLNISIASFSDQARDWVDALIVWDTDERSFRMDFDAMCEAIEASCAFWGVTVGPEAFLDVLFSSSVDEVIGQYMQFPFDQVEDFRAWMPDNELIDVGSTVKEGFCETVAKAVKGAWKTGESIRALFESTITLRLEREGKTGFEFYGAYFVDALSYHSLICANGGLQKYDWRYLEKLSIEELERIRQSMVSLINNDERLFQYFLELRNLNEEAGWPFKLKLEEGGEERYFLAKDYPNASALEDAASWLNGYKHSLLDMPASIRAITG